MDSTSGRCSRCRLRGMVNELDLCSRGNGCVWHPRHRVDGHRFQSVRVDHGAVGRGEAAFRGELCRGDCRCRNHALAELDHRAFDELMAWRTTICPSSPSSLIAQPISRDAQSCVQFVPNWIRIMPKKSARVVLTLLGSAALGAGCSQAPPAPQSDSFTSQIDFEKNPEDKQADEQPTSVVGQTAAAPTTSHSSHYHHRGPSIWPLFWMSSRQSSPIYRPGTPSSVPRGPSHVTPPIPSHSGHAGNSTTRSSPSHPPTTHSTHGHSSSTHSTTTHAGSTSHVHSHGFGSTGHAISGGS